MTKGAKIEQKVTWQDWFALVARLTLGAVLIFSGLSKILGPAEEFAAAIEKYQAVPPDLVMAVARFLPWIEYCVGGFLILGYCVRLSALSAGILWSLFISMLTASKLRGIVINDCGCFGSHGPHFSTLEAIALDSLLLTLSVVLFLAKNHIFALDN